MCQYVVLYQEGLRYTTPMYLHTGTAPSLQVRMLHYTGIASEA